MFCVEVESVNSQTASGLRVALVGFKRFLTRRKRSTMALGLEFPTSCLVSACFDVFSILCLAKDCRPCRTLECPYCLYAVGTKGVRCESLSRAAFTFP